MRTDIPAALQTVLASGGYVYWLIIITPNTGDSWTTPIACGNIAGASLAGYTVWANRLLEISDIDQGLDDDPIENPVAKTTDVDFIVQNLDDSIDPLLYQGRKIDIRMGYGTTMSIATSTIMFAGLIKSVDAGDRRISFKCQGELL